MAAVVVTKVLLSRFAQKQLDRMPRHIEAAFRTWVVLVSTVGIRETRRSPGFHDEPLKGQRSGQRSVRLNRAYRVIYVETREGIEIQVIEVSKHEY
jgi:proteic killer suppression protein